MPLLVRLIILLLISCCLAGTAMAASRPYVVDVQLKPPIAEDNYYIKLLRLLLNASKAADEVIEFRFSHDHISQARWIAAIEKDKHNNVLWTMTNQEREKSMRAIRVPIFRGLMGYRLLIIRKADEEKFSRVKTKEDLMAFSAGQGMHWPDTAILRESQFQLMEATNKENLYKMLVAKRFDFFPRGAIEITIEDGLIREHNLLVEPHLVLHYKADLYFFVNKNNTNLAERLERGWAIIQRNGAFDKLFYNTDCVKIALTFLKQPGRRIIELQNPFLPKDTPLQAPGYWLDVSAGR